MGNIAPLKKNISIASKGLSRGFKFRWWMAILIIAGVAAVGILVLRFSNASTIPPEELAKIESGLKIDVSKSGLTISYDPYSYQRSFTAQESLKASQDINEFNRINELVATDLEKLYIKNNPGSGQSTAPATSAPAESPDLVKKNNSELSADQTTDLKTISGYTKFIYEPSDKADIKAVNLLLDNKIIKIVKKQPFEFSLDSLAYSNGKHKMQLVVTKKDNTQTIKNYSVEIKNSSFISRLLYFIGLPWAVVLPS